MFYKDICFKLLNGSLGRKQRFSYLDIVLNRQNHFKNSFSSIPSFQFSQVTNTIQNKNPHINSVGETPLIRWDKVLSAKAIYGVLNKFKIPTVVGDQKYFYVQQMQLYTAIFNLSQVEDLQDNLFEVFVKLHNSAIQNLAKMKSQTQYKNDRIFNNFCIALFKAQILLKKKNISLEKNIQNDTLFLQTLLSDKIPVPSFMSEVIPYLSFEELKECCSILLQTNQADLIIKIVNTPTQYLSVEHKNQLQSEYLTFIHPQKFSSLNYLMQYFDFNLQVVLNNQQVSSMESESAQLRCLEAIDVFFKNLTVQKNLNTQISKIKSFLQMIQMSKFQVSKQQIFTLEKIFSKAEETNSSSQHIILDIIQHLETLSFLEEDKQEILDYLDSQKSKLLETLASSQLKAHNDQQNYIIAELSQKIQGVEDQEHIKNHKEFQQIQEIMNKCVKISDIIQLLLTVSKSNRQAAKLLVQPDILALICENVIFMNQSSFSKLIALNNRVLDIPIELMIQYIQKNYQNFSPLLLTQTLYLISSSNTQRNYDAQELIVKIIKDINNMKDKLQYEELNLLLKCCQFIKMEAQLYIIQDIIENISNQRINQEPKYANMLFNLFQHKILKQGLQSKYAQNQIKQIAELIQNKDITKFDLDLLSLALLVQATNKFSYDENSQVINKFFLEQANKYFDKVKSEQLAYMYISVIQASFIIQNSNNTQLIERYEKQILKNLNSGNRYQSIKFNQVVKVMHELSKVFHLLDNQRKSFLSQIYQKTLQIYKVDQDYGLSIWIFWQQSLICNNIDQYVNLYNLIKENIITVAKHELNNQLNQSVKLKQYKQSMVNQVQEITIIQLYQSLYYYQVNESLYKKNPYLHEEIQRIQEIINQNSVIQNYQRAQTVKHSSNTEYSISVVIKKALKELNLNYHNLEEQRIENIFFVDNYIQELNLIIECHGFQHFVQQSIYYSEQARNKYIQSKGYKIEIIPTFDWINLTQEEQLKKMIEIISKYTK
ncbi:RAP domain protein (macronuclear) [Tetrahymena thermophila SB210]|uniref:RAP domain protein n=1 Tax=Tetrahymena thermophila (strain SB210) TaxID=312017 RepID=Q22VW5_TETTS|nr:RAP domain protein [Tetrahymena thermophila SB210]EAR89651.1 RAP domain protein [Tetrahymena thermophila SB210]|eukprot:XP_001009897.1 RAP domain protein [Tetrahymena thermophila SB210]